MSHQSTEPKICPNCNYPAVENYCAQCGQEVHLHKDTFGALVAHFAGHYLHYDSKFWKTLKALWFSPGLLTTAYWEEKRMRYIPPISLYIFLSFVFFLTQSLVGNKEQEKLVEGKTYSIGKTGKATITKVDPKSGGVMQIQFDSTTAKQIAKTEDSVNIVDNDKLNMSVNKLSLFGWDIAKSLKKRPDMIKHVKDEAQHLYPKLFFFMIPFMAFILKLLFFRRKELYYVNHVIFSLHYHAFWFSVKTLGELYVFPRGGGLIALICAAIYVIYMVKSMHNVYNISRWRSFFYGTIIGFFYMMVFAIAFVTMLLCILWCA